jgi:Spy/CpxP family protein refolding chaperone
MSKKVILIILIVSVAINLATVITFAYYWSSEHRQPLSHDPRFPDRFQKERRERLIKELNLQKEQIEILKKMQEEIHMSVRPVREEMQRKRHELMSMVHEQNIDQEKVKETIKQIAALQAEHDTRIFTGMMKIKKMLSSEQQEKLNLLLHRLMDPEPPMHSPHEPGMPHQPHPPQHEGPK